MKKIYNYVLIKIIVHATVVQVGDKLEMARFRTQDLLSASLTRYQLSFPEKNDL